VWIEAPVASFMIHHCVCVCVCVCVGRGGGAAWGGGVMRWGGGGERGVYQYSNLRGFSIWITKSTPPPLPAPILHTEL